MNISFLFLRKIIENPRKKKLCIPSTNGALIKKAQNKHTADNRYVGGKTKSILVVIWLQYSKIKGGDHLILSPDELNENIPHHYKTFLAIHSF